MGHMRKNMIVQRRTPDNGQRGQQMGEDRSVLIG